MEIIQCKLVRHIRVKKGAAEGEGSGLEQGHGPSEVLVQRKVIEGLDITEMGTILRKVIV